MSKEQQNQSNGQTVLDVILEKTSNIEATSNRSTIHKLLSEELKINGRREHKLRHETITIKTRDPKEDVIREIEEGWTNKECKLAPTVWQDKENVYVQFASSEEKNDFLDFAITGKGAKDIFKNIVKPNPEGLHFTRRMVRAIITNVRGNIKLNIIEDSLKRMFRNTDAKLEDLREGKPIAHGVGQLNVRNVMFKLDSIGFRVLFKAHDGVIPYSNPQTNTRIKLIARINARPYQCRECAQLGQHQCKGKTCGQCGMSGHLSKDCKSLTKYCPNCKRKGHRVKDLHCPTYLSEMSKEIRKMDIPLEFLVETEYRDMLLKHIQLK